jgi:DNA-binding transcriptional ArsR family regulator
MNDVSDMNDDALVRIWQDGAMTESSADRERDPQAVRTVTDVAMLKAMADPTRLAILTALMHGGAQLPVMSVKELAEQLGEPQTKLYRHVRQLETAGLIRVAATRMVSGILEQRYQAAQHDLTFGPGFLREHPGETRSATTAVLERFRDGVLDSLATADESSRPVVFLASEPRFSRARAEELKARLKEVMDFVEAGGDDPDGIEVNLLMGMYIRPAAGAGEQHGGPGS